MNLGLTLTPQDSDVMTGQSIMVDRGAAFTKLKPEGAGKYPSLRRS